MFILIECSSSDNLDRADSEGALEDVNGHCLVRQVAASPFLLCRTVFKLLSSQFFTSNVGNSVTLAAC